MLVAGSILLFNRSVPTHYTISYVHLTSFSTPTGACFVPHTHPLPIHNNNIFD